jgi:hypothetical protein
MSRIFINRFFKFLLIALAGLLLLELSLHFFTVSNPFYVSPDLFSEKLQSEKSGVDVYFVGDSTIYGIGASVTGDYSLPAQFEKIMQEKRPGFRVLNLGVAGSGTEEHLDLLNLLPDGATVVYRGGTSDKWRLGLSFRFRFGAFEFEFRTMKMFYMLFARFLFSDTSLRIRILNRRLQKLLDRKALRIFTLDYTACPSLRAFYSSDQRLISVPLRKMIREKGFGNKGLDRKFISNISPAHANDMGYYIEAVLLFNFFCDKKELGLSEEDALSFQDISEFSGIMKARYQTLKAGLAHFTMEKMLEKTSSVTGRVMEAMAIAEIIAEQADGDIYRWEREALDKLLALFFHSAGHLSQHLISSQGGVKMARTAEDFHKLRLYYTVLWATTGSKQSIWASAHERAFGQPFPLDGVSISYLPLITPYPLELCRKFIREGGFTAEELSVRRELEYFFPLISYDDFYKLFRPACN